MIRHFDVISCILSAYIYVMRETNISERICTQLIVASCAPANIFLPHHMANKIQHYKFAEYFNRAIGLHRKDCGEPYIQLHFWYNRYQNLFDIVVNPCYCVSHSEDLYDEFDDAKNSLTIIETQKFLRMLFDNGIKVDITQDDRDTVLI